MFPPSFYAHAFNGILLLISLILIITNINKINQFDLYKKIMLLLVFTLVVGIHGLSHLGQESEYNYLNILYK